MIINGKTVAFLGDSITFGVGASCVENRYTNVFERITGSKIFVDGISGTRIARQSYCTDDMTNVDAFDKDFISRVDSLVDNADIVVVFGGTNDFGHGDADFGEMNDRTPYTFYGALHTLIQKLINKYPTSQLVFITPLHRITENNTVNERGRECHPLIDYINAEREVCEYYSIPVLDLYATSGIQPSVEIIKSIYLPDGLHPSDKGAELIARKLAAFISTL